MKLRVSDINYSVLILATFSKPSISHIDPKGELEWLDRPPTYTSPKLSPSFAVENVWSLEKHEIDPSPYMGQDVVLPRRIENVALIDPVPKAEGKKKAGIFPKNIFRTSRGEGSSSPKPAEPAANVNRPVVGVFYFPDDVLASDKKYLPKKFDESSLRDWFLYYKSLEVDDRSILTFFEDRFPEIGNYKKMAFSKPRKITDILQHIPNNIANQNPLRMDFLQFFFWMNFCAKATAIGAERSPNVERDLAFYAALLSLKQKFRGEIYRERIIRVLLNLLKNRLKLEETAIRGVLSHESNKMFWLREFIFPHDEPEEAFHDPSKLRAQATFDNRIDSILQELPNRNHYQNIRLVKDLANLAKTDATTSVQTKTAALFTLNYIASESYGKGSTNDRLATIRELARACINLLRNENSLHPQHSVLLQRMMGQEVTRPSEFKLP